MTYSLYNLNLPENVSGRPSSSTLGPSLPSPPRTQVTLPTLGTLSGQDIHTAQINTQSNHNTQPPNPSRLNPNLSLPPQQAGSSTSGPSRTAPTSGSNMETAATPTPPVPTIGPTPAVAIPQIPVPSGAPPLQLPRTLYASPEPKSPSPLPSPEASPSKTKFAPIVPGHKADPLQLRLTRWRQASTRHRAHRQPLS